MFDGIVVSGEEKMIKPDERLYRVLIDRYGFVPSGSVFIDDSPANIEAARQLGFRTVHFRDAGDTRRQLVAMGVIQD